MNNTSGDKSTVIKNYKKDPNKITPDMKKNPNCPCPDDPKGKYECIYKGYCQLCREYHATQDAGDIIWCQLPPGKEQYLLDYADVEFLHETYASIPAPPLGATGIANCPCKIKCAYHGFCDLCKAHCERFHACSPNCDK